jgi:hypothetical protein
MFGTNALISHDLAPQQNRKRVGHQYGVSPGSWEANRTLRPNNFAVSGVDQAVSLTLHDDTVRMRMNDAGINPHPVGQSAFVGRIRSDIARYDRVIR